MIPAVLLFSLHLFLADDRIREEELRKLVEAWTQAQNRRDFSAYEALYDQRFTGVRRSGPRVAKLDRKGWLSDRARMFQKPMHVGVEDLEIASTPANARVLFTQTWKSGGFKDVGRKQLVVMKTREGLRITREEMLSSRMVRGGSEDSKRIAGIFLVDDGYVLFDTAPKEAWASGSPFGQGNDVAWRRTLEKALPKEVVDWKARPLLIFGETNEICRANVSEFLLRAEVEPHFSTRAAWAGGDGDSPKSKAAIAKDVWALSEGEGRSLWGRLPPSCKAGRFAMSADGPTPRLGEITQAPLGLRTLALSEFRKLSAYQAIAEAYQSSGDASSRKEFWDSDEGSRPHVFVIRNPKSGRDLVLVSARAGSGCGGFEGRLSGLWEVERGEPRPSLVPIGLPLDLGSVTPRVAFDLDGAGHLTLIVTSDDIVDERSLLHWRGKAYERKVLYAVPFLDCPC